MSWKRVVAGAMAMAIYGLPAATEAKGKAKRPAADEEAGENTPARRKDEGWFVLGHAGLMRLSGDTFTMYGETPPGVPGGLKQDVHDRMVKRLEQVPIYVAATREAVFTLSNAGIGHPEGKEIKLDVADPPVLIPCCVKIDAEGAPWMLASDAVGHREDSGKWKFQKRSDLKLDHGLLRDLAIDVNDQPWVVGPSGLLYLEGKDWKTFNTTPPTQFVAVAANGEAVVAMAGDNIVRIQRGKMVARFPMDHSWRSEELAGFAINDDNDVVVAARSGRLLVLTDGTTPAQYSAQKDMKATFIRAVATDTRRRIWVSTDNGLAILSDGAFKLYPNGSIPQLAGAITNMALVGKGPELPEPVEPPKVTVRGRLLAASDGITVMLCPHPLEGGGSNPCLSKSTFTATSDSSGNYVFKDVPVGGYGRAWKEGSATTWQAISGDNLSIRGTGTVDLGELDVR